MAPIEWNGVKINVLDAPGYADFVGDLRSAVRAVDAVIVVVSAVDGVEVQTEAAWELAVEAGLPRAIFVNKLDRERSSFQGTLDQLVSSFGNQVAPLELPIGAEHEFSGIADLLHAKADRYPNGPIAEEGEWPDDLHATADPSREKLMEAVAEADDALIEKYLEEGSLSEEEIAVGVKAGFANARIAPVICGSAAKAIGVDRLLAFIAEEFPSPLDRPPVEVTSKNGDVKERDMRRDRSYRRVRLQDGLGPVRRTHHDVPRVLGQGSARLLGLQRHAAHRGTGRVSCSRCGARIMRTSPRSRQATSARSRSSTHTHTGDTLCHEGRPDAAAGDRAPRAAAGVRRGTQDQGRRGQALDRPRPPARGGSHAAGRALRRDARDRDVRHGRGAPRGADGAAEAQVRRGGRRRIRRRSRIARRSRRRRRGSGVT